MVAGAGAHTGDRDSVQHLKCLRSDLMDPRFGVDHAGEHVNGMSENTGHIPPWPPAVLALGPCP